MLKVNETFYSLQGEGHWTGQTIFFIRLSGCNLNCPWCDTQYETFTQKEEEVLVKEALEFPSKRVVITGGEPTLQCLRKLTSLLHFGGLKTHLETNGTQIIARDNWDWVAVSPKSPVKTLNPRTMSMTNEIKIICGLPNWEKYISEVIKTCNPKESRFFLMPLAEGSNGIKTHLPKAIEYCLNDPEFTLCLQMHKIIGGKC